VSNVTWKHTFDNPKNPIARTTRQGRRQGYLKALLKMRWFVGEERIMRKKQENEGTTTHIYRLRSCIRIRIDEQIRAIRSKQRNGPNQVMIHEDDKTHQPCVRATHRVPESQACGSKHGNLKDFSPQQGGSSLGVCVLVGANYLNRFFGHSS